VNVTVVWLSGWTREVEVEEELLALEIKLSKFKYSANKVHAVPAKKCWLIDLDTSARIVFIINSLVHHPTAQVTPM
jgi:hypothetical protein